MTHAAGQAPSATDQSIALEQRILVLAPDRVDAQMFQAILSGAGLSVTSCTDLAHMCREMVAGAAAVLLTEEALAPEQLGDLMAALGGQLEWSELPVLIVTQGEAKAPVAAWAMGHLDNVILLERPIQRLTLVSAARSAVRSHQRRYQLRGYLTEQRRQQEALRESERRLGFVCESIPHMVWSAYPDGRIDYVNQRVLDYTGARREDLAGWGWLPYIHPEDRQLTAEYWTSALRNGSEVRFGYRLRNGQTGEYRWYAVHALPLRDAAGQILRWYGTCTDIDEQRRAEKALRDSEAQLRALTEAMPQLVWIARPDGHHEYFNTGCHDYLGMNFEELAGTGWVDCLHPDDRQRTLERWDRSLRAGEPYEIEYRLRRARDGAYRWFLARAVPMRDEQGQILRWFGTCTDIDEQKRAEEAMRISEEKFAKVFASNPAAITLSRLEDGTYLEVNDTWVAMHGFSRAEAIGQSSVGLGVWPTPEARARFVQALREKGSLMGWEEQFRRKSGETFVGQISAQIQVVSGVQVMIASFVDITNRKRAEAALRSALVELQRFREALENVPAYVYMKDLQFRYLYANKLTLELFGCSARELVGRDDYCFFPPESARRLREIDQRVVAGRQSSEEVFGAEIGGRRRVYLEYKTPIYSDPDGKIICGILGISTDITERKAAEETLAAARAAAEKANQAKDHFLAVLSHELRTPLTPVLPVLEELARQVPEAAREDVEMARRNVELEARLIDDLLDVTRISRGKIELHRESVELCTVMRRAAEVCAPDIEARGLHFGIEVEGGPYAVHADPARLQQVFWNLIKNAIKFTPHGGCVGIHCQGIDGHVVAHVKDSGMGIEQEALLRIFNAFEQVDRSVTRQFGGLGLGLAISKALVEQHGGTITAQSEGKDKGATFTVTLPMLTATEGARTAITPGNAATGAAAAPTRPMHILLVEDHGDTARIMCRLLQAKGHHVETAGDVATALALARKKSFDLLVSDLGLPDGSGADLMRQLRESGQRVPGIALSGYGQEEDIRRSREAGFREHLTKPVNFGQLEAAIRRVT